MPGKKILPLFNLNVIIYNKIILKLFKYTNNSLHLAQKYARIFVRGHYLVPRSEQFSEREARGKL